MKKLILLVLAALAVYGVYQAWSRGLGPFRSSSNITISDDEVTVDMEDLEGTLFVASDLDDTYVLFGGSYMSHKNTLGPIFLAGLTIDDAKGIYASYPDFHLSASPGASLAKSMMQDLSIIPYNTPVLRTLKSVIKEFEQNLREEGERVCVALEGEQLELESVIVKQNEQELVHHYPSKRFYLIRFAEQVDCKSLLENED